LDEDDICTTFDDFYDHSSYIPLFFFEDSINVLMAFDCDCVLYVGFWGGEAELDNSDSGIFHSSWAICFPSWSLL
jgi:hypothetical protein